MLTSTTNPSVDSVQTEKSAKIQFAQIALPYAYNALEPNIDSMTMDIHYNKHHAAYIKNVNDAIAAENIDFASEKDFFANTSKLSPKARNNGGGAWNHNFFWQVMTPQSQGGAPTGKILDAINGARFLR
jgi:Fe-Mn family superoxide dismutase